MLKYFSGFRLALICVRLHDNIYKCPSWDTGEALQSTTDAQILSQAGILEDSLLCASYYLFAQQESRSIGNLSEELLLRKL